MKNAVFNATPWVAVTVMVLGLTLADATQAAKKCRAPKNLVEDGSFLTLNGGDGIPVWRTRQHAHGGSFTTVVDNGELRIEKVGPEPWFVLYQKVPGPGYQKRTVRYEVDLKLELTQPDPMHGFEKGGGLYFAVLNPGRRYLLRSFMEQEPNFGTTEWQRVSMEFDVPAGAKDLEVGFQHQAGGVLRIRDPWLYLVHPNTCDAASLPDA